MLTFARAHRAEALADLRREITETVSRALGQIIAPDWSMAGMRPANFSLARVGQRVRIGADFIRLRLHGEAMARFAPDDSMHFRMILPQGEGPPQWPQIGPKGQTVWPGGAHALHRPVYTVRTCDAAQGWLETDIFLHAGGRVPEWAQRVAEGAEIGISGPNGGGIAQNGALLLAGDETAYPAIARIIEARPDASGEIWLCGRADYPMPAHGGMRIHHSVDGFDGLARALRGALPADCFVWIGAQKRVVTALRGLILDELGHDPGLTHLAAYWSD